MIPRLWFAEDRLLQKKLIEIKTSFSGSGSSRSTHSPLNIIAYEPPNQPLPKPSQKSEQESDIGEEESAWKFIKRQKSKQGFSETYQKTTPPPP